MTSIRKALLRGLGFAAASGALLSAPSFAGTQPGAEQLATKDAPLAISEAQDKNPQIAQTYVPLVGNVGSASVQGTGFYVTLGAGYAWPSNIDFEDNLADYNFNGNLNLDGGFSGDIGLGYDFGAIRTELTYGYTRNSLNQVHVSNFDTFNGTGNLDKQDVLASVYLDIPFGPWVPYIGGGVGYSNFRTPGFTVDDYRFSSSNHGTFGWQGKLGLAYALNWNADLYVEGVYQGASGFTTDNLDYSSYNNWGAKAGFRWRFGHPPVVVVEAPAPAPAPEPAPAPMPMPEPAPEPVRGLW